MEVRRELQEGGSKCGPEGKKDLAMGVHEDQSGEGWVRTSVPTQGT